MNSHANRHRLRALAGLVLLLAGCGVPAQIGLQVTLGPTQSTQGAGLTATPEPPPPKTLIICLRQEPTSLYLYSDTNREADAVLAAIYDGPFDLRHYQYQPVILEKAPSLADGARVEPVAVTSGEVAYNPVTGQPESLKVGKPYLPSGCRGPECIQTYQGGQVSMDQMLVEFHLLPGLTWSDGQPLTAQDSVFSFNLDSNKDTPSTKFVVDRTRSYEAVDASTVRWTGIPGFLDAEFADNFRTPLPEHLLQALAPADLLKDERATRQPVGWGPYIIKEWRAGEQIVLSRNPLYFRAAQGLPAFDFLIYRFVGDDVNAGIQQLLTGECDVLDESVLTPGPGEAGLQPDSLAKLLELQQAKRLKLEWSPGTLVERADFDLAPVAQGTPALFADPRTRRALAGCIDRKTLVEQVFSGLGEVTQSYLEPEHPLYQAVATPAYDPAASAELLTQAGWVDDDGKPETPRVARGVTRVKDGTPLEFTYLAAQGGFSAAVAERIKADLARCGAGVTVQLASADQVFSPWPAGLAFGRKSELVVWPWPALFTPPCEMFTASEIATDAKPYGINASAFSDPTYDQACAGLLLGGLDGDTARRAAAQTQAILADQVPSLPLFVRPRLVATRVDLCGVDLDPSAFTELWNLERFQSGVACKGG